MTRVGILGLSEGNGHPFSFSAILNGYEDAGFADSGWPVIHAYLRRRDPAEFGIADLRVTHAWTQSPDVTRRLQAACGIEHGVTEPLSMLGEVDAIILARDDHETHRAIAAPFLEAGVPVLVDKPLALSSDDLEFFRPYLESNQLMSCAAMRFAAELDEVRDALEAYGEILLIRGAVLNDWARYGIHMVDAILPLLRGRVVSVQALPGRHDSFALGVSDGSLVQIDALGAVPKTFQVDVYGTHRVSRHEIADNFTMFRRLLTHFAAMLQGHGSGIPVADTLAAMEILQAGVRSRADGRKVMLAD